MGIDAALVLVVVALTLGVLLFTRYPPDAVLVGAVTLLMVIPTPEGSPAGGWRMGVISIHDGLAGMSNPGMATVAVLFVVVAGLRETGAIHLATGYLLGRPTTLRRAVGSIVAPVGLLSAFLNNTPVVAMMIPAVNDWARRMKLAPSKLMIPLSYAAILGGMCTLIGTSTNLVVAGLVLDETNLPAPGIFDVSLVGIPAAVIGAAYLVLIVPRLLPDRRSVSAEFDNPREYTAEMLVPPDSPLLGKTVENAGLRNLPGLYLIEIDRQTSASVDLDPDRTATEDDDTGPPPQATISPVGPHERLYANDRLIFAGVVDSIRDLQKTRGLVPANEQVFKLSAPRHYRRLFEVVVSQQNPLIGKTIREGGFRSRYQAAILAVARDGKRLIGKVGDVTLRPGDTLLIEAGEAFLSHQRHSRDFFLVTGVDDSRPHRYERAPLALAILGGMVLLAAINLMPMLLAAMLAAGALVLTRCCTMRDARDSVEWPVLIVIAAALAIGRALQITGAADALASAILSLAAGSPLLTLIAIYVLTNLLTELITNNAAVALSFPIALAASTSLGVNFQPFIFTIMIAGSASFASPLGYQTNLMVMGPGGYRFADYLRVGLPLNAIVGLVTCALAPIIWGL